MSGAQKYFVKMNWLEGRTGLAHVDGKPILKVGPPPQFGGGKEDWSPEELLLAALASCLMATFFTFAKNEALEILGYDGVAYGILRKMPAGFGWEGLTNEVKLEIDPKDEERAKLLLLKAKKNCIISNSMNTEVALNMVINGVSEEQPLAARVAVSAG